jgi:hypothetical protein
MCHRTHQIITSAQPQTATVKKKEAFYIHFFVLILISMEFQLQEETAEAAYLVSSFSLNVATQHPDDVIATALHDQELAQRQERSTQLSGERQWKVFYEDNTRSGRYVT